MILCLIIIVAGCVDHNSSASQNSLEYYKQNEDNFSFLVFDKSKIYTFFKNINH